MKPSLGIRRRLNTLGNLSNNELDLSETALILAKIERPGANTAIYKRHLKKLTADVANYANKDANDERVGLSTRIESLRQIVAKRYGYCGNDAAYENFESSNLMRVSAHPISGYLLQELNLLSGLAPAFGEDEILTKEQIDIVSFYVANSVGK